MTPMVASVFALEEYSASGKSQSEGTAHTSLYPSALRPVLPPVIGCRFHARLHTSP